MCPPTIALLLTVCVLQIQINCVRSGRAFPIPGFESLASFGEGGPASLTGGGKDDGKKEEQSPFSIAEAPTEALSGGKGGIPGPEALTGPGGKTKGKKEEDSPFSLAEEPTKALSGGVPDADFGSLAQAPTGIFAAKFGKFNSVADSVPGGEAAEIVPTGLAGGDKAGSKKTETNKDKSASNADAGSKKGDKGEAAAIPGSEVLAAGPGMAPDFSHIIG